MFNFHAEKIGKCLNILKTSAGGISFKEAEKRLAKYGENKLPEKKPVGKAFIFLSQFNNPLILILAVAGIISFFLSDLADAGIIFAAIVINIAVGYLEENKANESLIKIKSLIEHKAVVLREGKEYLLESRLIVPGDIIVLSAGNKVPADARLIEAVNLEANESALTGEAVPSAKNTEELSAGAALADRKNMVYAGTIIVSGFGRAAVVAAGGRTEMGKIASLVSETKEDETPLQKKLAKFSRFLGIFIGVLSLFVVFLGIISGRDAFQMFLTGVALAVAAIPEGLGVAVTVILALGMRKILKNKALVRKLIAAETLGSTSVICADKTGTLTEGKMHVAHIITGEKEFGAGMPDAEQEKEEALAVNLALRAGAMCNDAEIENQQDDLSEWKIIGGPTDAAILSAAAQSGLDKSELLKEEPRISELPFTSEQKIMATLHRKKTGWALYEKGAPEKILDKAGYYYNEGKKIKLSRQKREALQKKYKSFTEKGLRVLAVAYKDISDLPDEKKIFWEELEKNLVFIAFIALKDPLRPEAEETIKVCAQAGIKPIIITGDHPLTAAAVARDAGLKAGKKNILTGEELEKTSDENLKKIVKDVDIYARVSPHHKLRIVNALKARGEVVAMTGDGINDSPALRAADIGISLGTGTDIAKENADLVLLDNNFKTIVAAVFEGRVIFANIRKVITFLLSDNFSQIIMVAGSIILGLPLALLPAQILWMNIIQDGLPDFSLAMEKGDDGIMKEKPLKRDESILNFEMKWIIFFAGTARDLLVFGLFIYLLKFAMADITYVRTAVFAALSVSSLVSLFGIRMLSRPIWKINFFANKYLLGAVGISFCFLAAGIYWPPLQNLLSTCALDARIWGTILSISLASLAMIEAVKQVFAVEKENGK